jgi:hypothetical protein
MMQDHTLGARPKFLEWNTIAYLEAAYPGQALLTVSQTAQALALHDKTVRNRLSAGVFPIQNVGEPGKPAFRKIDVAAFIDGFVVEKNKGGRPSKAAQIAQRGGV